jgi:hypothetical protein
MPLYNITDQDQTGGWKSLSIAPINDVLSCPDIITNANANTISLNSGPETIDIIPVTESIKIQSTPRRSKNGFLYNIKITTDFYYQSKVLDDFLHEYVNKKVVAFGITTYGTEKFYGSVLHPLTFDYEFIDGKNIEQAATCRVSLTGNIPQKPVIITE